MADFVLYGCAAVGAVMIGVVLIACLAAAVTLLISDRVRPLIHSIRVRGRGIEAMPGHPEAVRELGDPVADEAFGDIAEALLDDGLADITEDTGWMQ